MAEWCWDDHWLLMLIFSLIGQRVQSELGSILFSDRHACVKAHFLCQADYRYLMGFLIYLCILYQGPVKGWYRRRVVYIWPVPWIPGLFKICFTWWITKCEDLGRTFLEFWFGEFVDLFQISAFFLYFHNIIFLFFQQNQSYCNYNVFDDTWDTAPLYLFPSSKPIN